MYSPIEINNFLSQKVDSWDFIKAVSKEDLIKQIHEIGGNNFKTPPLTHQLACFLIGINKGSFLYFAFPGSGKAQPLDSKVLTPVGWEILGNLKISDRVISPDNTVKKIIAINDFVNKDIYKITFNDNSCTECCEDHLWKIYNNKTYKKNKNKTFEIISLKELIRRGLKYSCYTNKYKIPMVQAIDFISSDDKRPVISSIYGIANLLAVDFISVYKWIKKLGIKPVLYVNHKKYYNFYALLQQLLTIKCKRSYHLNSKIKILNLKKEDYFYKLDPYLLGVLLGDGSFRKSITITNNDEEIINNTRSKLPKYCELVKFDTITYGIKSTNRLFYNQVLAEIRYLGLFDLKSEDKFIPQSYKLNNVEDRIALLQGLVDTDGYISNKGDVSYNTSSRQLCEDVCFIIQSLGGTVRVTSKIPVFVYKGKKKSGAIHYNISINLPEGIQPCRLTRKINRLKTKRKYLPNRLIKSIEYVGKKDARCITLDSKDGLYITNDFIVTHNSKLLLDVLNYLYYNKKVTRTLVLVPYTITIESWKDQIKEHSNFTYLPLLGSSKDRWKLLESAKNYDIVGISYPGLTAMIPSSVLKRSNRKEIILDYKVLDDFASNFDSIVYDECFAKDSLVNTPNGLIKIQKFKINDLVYNLNGVDTVKKIFVNKVKLCGIVKITLSNNKIIFCSKNHIFFTTSGEVPAELLKNKLISPLKFGIMQNSLLNTIISLTLGIFFYGKSLFNVWRYVFTQNECKNLQVMSIQKSLFTLWEFINWNIYQKILFIILQGKSKANSTNNKKLFNLWKRIFNKMGGSKILWAKLFCKMENVTKRDKGESILSQSNRENEEYSIVLKKRKSRKMGNYFKEFFRKNESKQSFPQSNKYRESENDKKSKWKFEHLERRKGRKWSFYSSTNTSCNSITLENGSCNLFTQVRTWLSNMLQGRYWKRVSEVRNRNRWKEAQFKKTKVIRQEKRGKIERIRVESVEIYQSGYNDESFSGIITDTERNQGFVEFYDLEIEKHPSYNIENIPVHNCHIIKGYKTIIFSICKYLSSKYAYKYGLTGTPTSRNLEDFWTQFYLIDGGETLGKTISFYRQAFFDQKFNYFGGYEYKINKKNKHLLFERIKNSSITYKDTEVFDLPEKVCIKKYFALSMQQRDFYKKAVDGVIEAKGDITLLGGIFVKLRQITSGFITFVSTEGEDVQIILDENPKLEALLELLNEIGDEKLVVFNEYTITGDIICGKLKQQKIGYERLYGDTENKYETMQNFLNDKDCRVYVVNSKSGAMSLNLQKAHYQVYFESPVSPIIREQADCRLFRIGQKHRTFIYDFVMKGTIDERILGFIAEGKDIYTELFSNSKILLT